MQFNTLTGRLVSSSLKSFSVSFHLFLTETYWRRPASPDILTWPPTVSNEVQLEFFLNMDQNEQPIGSKYVTVLGVVLFILCTLSKRLFNFQETPLSFGV